MLLYWSTFKFSLIFTHWCYEKTRLLKLAPLYWTFLNCFNFLQLVSLFPRSWNLLSLVFIHFNSFFLFFSFPGHSENRGFPLFVPEHYGDRCSQHLFDPYRQDRQWYFLSMATCVLIVACVKEHLNTGILMHAAGSTRAQFCWFPRATMH